MKVKCIDLKRQNHNDRMPGLTLGKEYVVLAIEFLDKSSLNYSHYSNSLGDFIIYRVEDDDGVVIPYPSKLFEITSNKLPSCWVSFDKNDGSYSILPSTWTRPYFWDDFYNDEPNALSDFRKAQENIYSEEVKRS